MIINDYIACLQTVDCRYADISYMAGIEDAITFLKKMDLIKNTIEQALRAAFLFFTQILKYTRVFR